MGNRAVITTRKGYLQGGLSLYLHWNGGRDSIEAFLKYCELRGFEPPEANGGRGWINLITVIANFFGDGAHMDLDRLANLDYDNGDNGTYIIDGWKIIGRKWAHVEQRNFDIDDMVLAIDDAQPEQSRLGEEYLTAEPIDSVYEPCLGDKVFFINWDGRPIGGKVIGYGKCRLVNGTMVSGIPYLKLDGFRNPENNINCYLYKAAENYRIIRAKKGA